MLLFETSGGHPPPPSHNFFEPPLPPLPIKVDAPHVVPPLKNKTPH